MILNDNIETNVDNQGAVVTGKSLDRSRNLIMNLISSAEKHSDDTAIYSDKKLTYAEFLDGVRKNAAILIENGIQQDDKVGVYCRHTAGTIILIYAVLYIGAVYVPIGADCPPDRIKYIVEKSSVKAVVSAEKPESDIGCDVICLSDMTPSDSELPVPCESTGQYAYCMFTSGTTGEPKGVLIRQEYLLNMCEWYGERFKLDSDSRLILLNNFGFDGSLKTIFTPLLYGSSIVLATDSLFDVKADAEIIKEYNVTHLACVPSLMQGILEYCQANGYKELESVRYFISAGEKFRSGDVLKWLRYGNCNAEFINLYGPAECSCCVSYHDVTEADLEKDIIPIGKPIYNKRMYILDERLEPCAAGTEGDIWIAGFGTFGGYIGMSPESSGLRADIMDNGSLMYMSGDRGKRLDNGEVLYCGRKDNQIKISGQRIEIEEIEQVLMRHDNITSCGLLVKSDEQPVKTIMFYSSADKKEMTYDELSGFMEKSLLKSVIPNRFVYLEKLPVSINGKLDRNALEGLIPANSEVKSEDTDEFTQKLVQGWKNTLEIDEVPLDSGFFELGGYSMLLYHLQSEIKEILGKDITPMEILAHPTVRNMSAFLRGEDTGSQETTGRRRIRRTRR